MKSDKSSLTFRIITIILTVSMVLFAFIHSMMPATVSAEESGGILILIETFLKNIGINASISEYIIRKSAHFAEFSLIGGLLTTCAYSFNRKKPYIYYAHILFCGLAVAVCDETIQLNVVGRSGQVSDIILDFCGIVFGTLFMLIAFMIYKQIRKSNAR